MPRNAPNANVERLSTIVRMSKASNLRPVAREVEGLPDSGRHAPLEAHSQSQSKDVRR